MTIPCDKNITKLKNDYTIGITITLQCLLQSTKHALSCNIRIKLKITFGNILLIQLYFLTNNF